MTLYDMLKYAYTGIASPDMTEYDKMKAAKIVKRLPPEAIGGNTPEAIGVKPSEKIRDGEAPTE